MCAQLLNTGGEATLGSVCECGGGRRGGGGCYGGIFVAWHPAAAAFGCVLLLPERPTGCCCCCWLCAQVVDMTDAVPIVVRHGRGDASMFEEQ